MTPAYHSITPLERARLQPAQAGLGNLDFLRGAPITAGLPTPWIFDIEIDSAQPPHLLGRQIPLASERLLKVLTDTGVDNIETFPAVLRGRGGAEWRQHYVINVIGLVDAADLGASSGTVIAEGPDGPTRIMFDHLVLAHAQARGLPLFRLFHDPATLLVEDRIMRALDAHRPVEGWGFAAFEIEVSVQD
jgi:Immunity protein family (Imm11)